MPVLERATAVIVAGAGGSANTALTTTGTTSPIQINSGDVAIALGLVPTTTSALTVSTPSNPNWQQRFFVSLNPFFLYLWTLENPVAANEPVTFTRPLAGSAIGVAQVYGGVGQIANVVHNAALATANPSLSPVVTTTVAGSMVVGAFAFNRGTQNSFAPSGQRVLIIGGAFTILLADQTIATPSNAQITTPYTSTSQAGTQWLAATLVLEPATVTPPGGSISDIVDQIRQWRLQAQQNKIYLMPPAQRAAALAQLKSLAQQLKAAQIAQRGG